MLGRRAMRMEMMKRTEATHGRAQAGIDFIVSYGFALVVIAIAIFILLKSNVLGASVYPEACYPAPSFLCVSDILFTNGTINIVFAQATGGTMDVLGIACSTAVNSLGDYPAYGNINVVSYTGMPSTYPNNAFQYGETVYSDNTSNAIEVNCYGPSGIINMAPGSPVGGYVWINYTQPGLSYARTELLATFTTKTV